MGLRNEEVVRRWARGQAGKSSNGNLHTDGQNLYSYAMLIGRHSDGLLEVLNVRGKFFYSQTTSQHVSLAARWANRVIDPVLTPSVHSWKKWREFPINQDFVDQYPGVHDHEK